MTRKWLNPARGRRKPIPWPGADNGSIRYRLSYSHSRGLSSGSNLACGRRLMRQKCFDRDPGRPETKLAHFVEMSIDLRV